MDSENNNECLLVPYDEKHIEKNNEILIVHCDEKLTEEHIFVLKYSEKNYIIKIQLMEINEKQFIRLIAQEKGVIINYYYQAEINENNFKKQDNELMGLFKTIPKLKKNDFEFFQ